MKRILLVLLVLVGVLAVTPARSEAVTERLGAVMLQQTPPHYDPGTVSPGAEETPEAYEARIRMAAGALSKATIRDRGNGTYAVVPPTWRWHRTTLVVAVAAHWYEESRFALEVHEGTKHPVWTSDRDRSRCLGQLQIGLVPKDAWEGLAGTDEEATERCALWTARALTRLALYCSKKGQERDFDAVMLGMFSAMGGSGCSPTVAGRRKVERFAKMWQSWQRLRVPEAVALQP
jgi:hypothetical protein